MDKIKMQYIGACALLGRVSRYVENLDDLEAIERALRECAESSESLEVIKTHHGFALEPKRA